jgi:hypothetical protein
VAPQHDCDQESHHLAGQLGAESTEDMIRVAMKMHRRIDDTQQNFCKRNFRTPAWVNNVISLHGS